jgi:ppGpp synthetase/RelA/SpoT-type nucleotidyltranferase
VSSPPINDLFREHLVEFPFWGKVAEAVGTELTAIIRHLRIPGRVEARAKSTGSVIGKAYRKPAEYADLANFRDLAGARVLVPFFEDVDPIAQELIGHPDLVVHKDETKVRAPDELTYQARHLDVELTAAFGLQAPWNTEARKIFCEVQIQTFAQSLWAGVSHLVTYKRDLPDDVHSRVNRLVVLCELFDDEATESKRLAMREIDDVGLIAHELQRYFYGITGLLHDPEQSVALVGRLMAALDDNERQTYSTILDQFVSSYADRLAMLLAEEPEARKLPWLLRPEVILIFERLTHKPNMLKTAWSQEFPVDDLSRLEAAWGPVGI